MDGSTVAQRAFPTDEGALARKWARTDAAERPVAHRGRFVLEDVGVSYGREVALADVNCEIEPRKVTALIGPSGCGKSTLLRCLNRMNDEIGGVKVSGRLSLDGEDINDRRMSSVALRSRVGQVFQQPNPFPLSIYDNVAYGPRLHGVKGKARLDEIVEDCLRKAALWDEVEDSLDRSAFALSGGQRQRLCIARALATDPEVLLMDEPCSALDPVSTNLVEQTIDGLRTNVTVVIVTHSMQQAARISDNAMFMLRESMTQPATLIEWGPTEKVFEHPADERTEAYIAGRFG